MRRLIYCISWIVHQAERFPIEKNSYIRTRISTADGVSLTGKCKMCASRVKRKEDKKVYIQYVWENDFLNDSYTFCLFVVYV